MPEPIIDQEGEFKTHYFYPTITLFSYPNNNPFDSEAMSYNYEDDSVYVVRKDSGEDHALFRLRVDPYRTNEAEYLCSFKGVEEGHVVTALDIHRKEKALIIRSYKPSNPYESSALYEYKYTNIESVCDSEPLKLENATESQGEAAAYNYLDGGIVHISEGYQPELFKLTCF